MDGSEIPFRGIGSKSVDMASQSFPSPNQSFEGGIGVQQVGVWKEGISD